MTPEARSSFMARVQTKNTAPEMRVRLFLHRIGFRYSLHRRDLPGRPDIVLPKHQVAIMVHGCFWHGCPHCKKGMHRPTTNTLFWTEKVKRNKERDDEKERALIKLGWLVLTVWECQTKTENSLVESISILLTRAEKWGIIRGP